MTSNDHNRTLAILHGLVGILAVTGIILAAVLEANRHPEEAVQRTAWLLYLLPLPLLQLATAYGLLSRRRWGRVLALLFSVLYVWLFPLGTLLAVYTWVFLHSKGGRQIYAAIPPAD